MDVIDEIDQNQEVLNDDTPESSLVDANEEEIQPASSDNSG
jgi:hypothetical protein